MINGLIRALTEENVSEKYQAAASEGRISDMLEIEESPLFAHVPPEIKQNAILSILPQAPFPILSYYLHGEVNGISKTVQKSFIEFAQENGIIDSPPLIFSTVHIQQPRQNIFERSYHLLKRVGLKRNH